MKQMILLFISLLLFNANSLMANAQDKNETAAAITAKPADVESLDAIIGALYDSISGPAGKRDWARVRSLFLPGARIIVNRPSSSGAFAARVLDIDSFIAGAAAYFEKNGFYEREIGRTTERFGNIAHAFSSYQSFHNASDRAPFARGINSIQLVNDGKRWWVVTIFYEEERPDNPIPNKYLQK